MSLFGDIYKVFCWSEINCLAKIHPGNADCMKSYENVASVLTNAYSD